ncbi:hypothetical protein D3C73_1525780 [compost metagenome]
MITAVTRQPGHALQSPGSGALPVDNIRRVADGMPDLQGDSTVLRLGILQQCDQDFIQKRRQARFIAGLIGYA